MKVEANLISEHNLLLEFYFNCSNNLNTFRNLEWKNFQVKNSFMPRGKNCDEGRAPNLQKLLVISSDEILRVFKKIFLTNIFVKNAKLYPFSSDPYTSHPTLPHPYGYVWAITADWNILSLSVFSVENSSAISVGQVKLLVAVAGWTCPIKDLEIKFDLDSTNN